MAKQVEVQNRFRIFAEVEAVELGPRLVQFAEMGLQGIGHELITDVISFKGNGPRKAHDSTGDQFAAAWVAEHPTFRALELVNYFRDGERTAGSAYTALRNMVAQDIVVKVAPGMYRRADVRELEAPKESQRGKHGHIRHEVTNWDFIRNAMKHRKRITAAELRTLFKEDGRNEASITPILTKMRAAKQLKDVGPGEYEILKPPSGKTPDEKKKDKDRLRQQAKRDAAKAARLNGATPTATETTNG
jgi:hypothetical protein